MRTRLGLALTLLGLLAGAFPLSAPAADYTVVGVCKDPVAGLTFTSILGTENIAGQEGCFSAPENGALTIAAKGVTMAGGVSWTMSAPAGLTFHTLEAQRRFVTKPWDTHFRWEILADGTAVETISGPSLPPDGAVVTTIDAQSVSGRLTCLGTTCPGLGPNATIAGVELKSINARISDETAPTVAIGGTAGTLHGTVDIPFAASDVGGGVAGARLIVDGIAQGLVSDDNGGDCVEPFHLLVPCAASLDSALPLDTTALQDGPHEIRVEAFDAAGQATATATRAITVRNNPASTERPALAGSATVGGMLTTTTGKWDGEPTSFSYQWLRCPATAQPGDQAGCTPIAAEEAQYTVRPLDAGKRLVANVTATNQFGSESALSAPSDLVPGPTSGGGDPTGGGGGPTGGGGGPKGGGRDTTPPVLGGVSLSPRRLRVGGKSTLKFSSSEAGKLSLAIAPARKKGGPRGTMTRTIAAGKGRLVFRGRIGAKALGPGRYKLTATVRDAAGNSSKPISLSFTILPG